MTLKILVERRVRTGRSGVSLWRYTWYDLDTGLLSETTVDRTFRNWRRQGWEALSQDPEPWGIYSGLVTGQRHTREGLPVVSADQSARMEHRLTRDQALAVMAEDHYQRQARTRWGDLFETAP